VATGINKDTEGAAVWREKINDYALEGMKNVNVILELLDEQKEEINKIEHQTSANTSLAL
jgi:hypothetical protein